MSLLAAAGAVAGVSAIQSAINGTVANVNAKANYKYQKRLTAYQNQLARENWQMENEYNLPVNQVQRLRDAGINPALAYGSTSLDNVGSSIDNVSVPSFNGYQMQAPDLTQIQGSISQAQLLQKQVEGVGYDNFLKSIQAAIEAANLEGSKRGKAAENRAKELANTATEVAIENASEVNRGLQYDNNYKYQNYEIQLEVARFQRDMQKMTIDEAKKSNIVTIMQTVANLLDTQYSNKEHLANIKFIAANTALTQAQENGLIASYKNTGTALIDSIRKAQGPGETFSAIMEWLLNAVANMVSGGSVSFGHNSGISLGRK